jgi:hypothetical protein
MQTANQLWKMCQTAPLPTKVGMIMTIALPNNLGKSISHLLLFPGKGSLPKLMAE